MIMYRNAMGKWENFNIAIATNQINNITFAWYTNVKGYNTKLNSNLLFWKNAVNINDGYFDWNNTYVKYKIEFCYS